MTSFKINRKLRILTPGFRADADVLCPALQRAECHAAFLKELAEELNILQAAGMNIRAQGVDAKAERVRADE